MLRPERKRLLRPCKPMLPSRETWYCTPARQALGRSAMEASTPTQLSFTPRTVARSRPHGAARKRPSWVRISICSLPAAGTVRSKSLPNGGCLLGQIQGVGFLLVPKQSPAQVTPGHRQPAASCTSSTKPNIASAEEDHSLAGTDRFCEREVPGWLRPRRDAKIAASSSCSRSMPNRDQSARFPLP